MDDNTNLIVSIIFMIIFALCIIYYFEIRNVIFKAIEKFHKFIITTYR